MLASIKPLQLIVAEVAADAGVALRTETLLPASATPHNYQLRPSERRRIAEADLLVWVGPHLERFLVKPVSLRERGAVLTVENVNTLTFVNPDKDDGDGHGSGDHAHHQHSVDPHIWLDPAAAIEIAQAAVVELRDLDPEHSDAYMSGLQVFIARVEALDSEIGQVFSGISHRSRFAVLHDGYSYFERRYGLAHSAAFAVSPDRSPGARHLVAMHDLMAHGGISCVIREPQYQPQWLDHLLADDGGRNTMRVTVLDSLAGSTSVEQGYTGFMRDFAMRLRECLAGL